MAICLSNKISTSCNHNINKKLSVGRKPETYTFVLMLNNTKQCNTKLKYNILIIKNIQRTRGPFTIMLRYFLGENLYSLLFYI